MSSPTQTVRGTKRGQPAVQQAGSDTVGAARRAAVTPGARPTPATGEEPAPTPGRLAGLCAWAALLGLVGVVVGIRGLVAILIKAPQWYEPTLIVLGLSGIALAVVAFLTVHYRHVPWFFLALSTGVLLASIVATAQAT
jgi:hypothetical protein